MMQAIDGIGIFTPRDARDTAEWRRIARFVASTPRAFGRDAHIGGHVTGSAFVLSPDRRCTLLTHHAKLGIWLQLGGHCDGIADAGFTALKEAYEESGLTRIKLLSPAVYDIDIHEIPANARDPAHLHYDIRYLMQAQAGKIAPTAESNALKWVPLDRLHQYSGAPSVLRLRDRLADFAE